jgi:hypothetical protein
MFSHNLFFQNNGKMENGYCTMKTSQQIALSVSIWQINQLLFFSNHPACHTSLLPISFSPQGSWVLPLG